MNGNAAIKPTVFISYSHKDEAWKDRIVTHLGVLAQEGLLDTWDDRRIGAGGAGGREGDDREDGVSQAGWGSEGVRRPAEIVVDIWKHKFTQDIHLGSTSGSCAGGATPRSHADAPPLVVFS